MIRAEFVAFHGVEVAMSRPGFSFIGLVILLGAFLALVLAAFLPARADAHAASSLGDDVIKMVQAELPHAVVVAKIKSSPCKFDTSTATLINLKFVGRSTACPHTKVRVRRGPLPSCVADWRLDITPS
jgi:hypothetical protein